MGVNIRKKFKGSATLVLTVITATMIGTIALSLVKLNSATVANLLSNKTQVQAQQYALSAANMIRSMRYAELVNDEYHIETTSAEPIDAEFSRSITINKGEKFTGSNSIDQLTVNIKIYHSSDLEPCVDLNIPRYDKDRSYMPVGAIVAWAGTGVPSEVNGKWLECNGDRISGTYSEITKESINYCKGHTPDFRGTYLSGGAKDLDDLQENPLNANLPNIKGTITLNYVRDGSVTGRGYSIGAFSLEESILSGLMLSKKGMFNAVSFAPKIILKFDASGSSPVYTDENEVRPNTSRIRFFIKAD